MSAGSKIPVWIGSDQVFRLSLGRVRSSGRVESGQAVQVTGFGYSGFTGITNFETAECCSGKQTGREIF